ncbi:MAG: hypothetical protein NXI10_11735 [bacterium]|nr:hypothetical protein [bacterium]
MKFAALLVFCLGVTGFVSAQERPFRPGNQKLKVTTSVNNSSNTNTNTQVNVHRGLNGTVRTASCGTYIEVVANGVTERYFPTNLEQAKMVDGLTISFDYVDDAKTAFPEGCEIKKSVLVNNVR